MGNRAEDEETRRRRKANGVIRVEKRRWNPWTATRRRTSIVATALMRVAPEKASVASVYPIT